MDLRVIRRSGGPRGDDGDAGELELAREALIGDDVVKDVWVRVGDMRDETFDERLELPASSSFGGGGFCLSLRRNKAAVGVVFGLERGEIGCCTGLEGWGGHDGYPFEFMTRGAVLAGGDWTGSGGVVAVAAPRNLRTPFMAPVSLSLSPPAIILVVPAAIIPVPAIILLGVCGGEGFDLNLKFE